MKSPVTQKTQEVKKTTNNSEAPITMSFDEAFPSALGFSYEVISEEPSEK